MPIPEQFIDELVARSEISDVVSSYVHLTRKGNNLWGLCPFHNEKYPFPLSWLAVASPAGPAPIMATFRPLRSMCRGLI